MKPGSAATGALLCAVLMLAGCAVREPRPEGAWLSERRAWFDSHPVWSVSGRLGLSDGERGGSLAMHWQSRGEHHRISLRTVAGGKQWLLEMSPGHAVLTGSDIDVLRGPDPDALVEHAVGWPIPVRWMSSWLRGLPAPAGADVEFAVDGTMESLAWERWWLDYQRWRETADGAILLPARVEARRAPHRVRASLANWKFEAASGHTVETEPL